MTKADLRALLKRCPIVASVQASPGSPLANPEILLASAQASIDENVVLLRLEGVESIKLIRSRTDCYTIGLIKREYPGSPVYITPTRREVEELLETGCDIIALDATLRPRPNGENIRDLVELIHSNGRLAMADCDDAKSARAARESWFDIVGTTLNGYTEATDFGKTTPNLELVRSIREIPSVIVLAEGRYAEPWQAAAALQIGADGVVIGGALNDPVKQTRRFLQAVPNRHRVIGIDLGGTWMRAGLFDAERRLIDKFQIPAPQTHQERLDFIQAYAEKHGVNQIGISAGGTIFPAENRVLEAKGFIPDYVGKSFVIDGYQIQAINDGLATAWGHACHPKFAGMRVATLALGTGIGAGLAGKGEIITDNFGNYPRINDAYIADGETIEQTLGGLALEQNPQDFEMNQTFVAAQTALNLLNDQFPKKIVVCGGVGLSDWFQNMMPRLDSKAPLAVSPYGENAGLYGAAHLVLNPPENLRR